MSTNGKIIWASESPDMHFEMNREDADKLPPETVVVAWGKLLQKAYAPKYSVLTVSYAGINHIIMAWRTMV